MTDDTYQLAYLSNRKHHVTDEDIVEGIVLPAITKNRLLGITGCLWFDPTHFFQVLEGSLDSIESIFAVIAKDHRHDSVDRVLTESTMGVRRFERFGVRAARSGAARSMPEFIAAYKERRSPASPRPSRWTDRVSRNQPDRHGEEKQSFDRLTRTIINQLADWSEATPA